MPSSTSLPLQTAHAAATRVLNLKLRNYQLSMGIEYHQLQQKTEYKNVQAVSTHLPGSDKKVISLSSITPDTSQVNRQTGKTC